MFLQMSLGSVWFVQPEHLFPLRFWVVEQLVCLVWFGLSLGLIPIASPQRFSPVCSVQKLL